MACRYMFIAVMPTPQEVCSFDKKKNVSFEHATWVGKSSQLLIVNFVFCPFTQVPIVIPIFVLIVSTVLFITPILNDPKPQFLIGLVFILSAFLIYIPFVYQKKRLSIVDNFTKFIQVLMVVVPPEKDEGDAEENRSVEDDEVGTEAPMIAAVV